MTEMVTSIEINSRMEHNWKKENGELEDRSTMIILRTKRKKMIKNK